MSHTYVLLLVTDLDDPSKVLNMIDDVRRSFETMASLADLDTIQRLEARCSELEKQLQFMYTPTGLLALSL